MGFNEKMFVMVWIWHWPKEKEKKKTLKSQKENDKYRGDEQQNIVNK